MSDQNKAKWASCYEEVDYSNFKGRDRETDELLKLIEYNDFSVLYAVSGEGKSSLINAGLKPKLRKRGYYPIVVRFCTEELENNATDFDIFVKNKIDQSNSENVNKYISETSFSKDESSVASRLERNVFSRNLYEQPLEAESHITWKYLKLIPILIFDQFEEVFYKDCTDKFFHWLNDLYKCSVNSKKFKVLLSLRNDYVSELDYWCMQRKDLFMPQIKNNRYCLKPLTIESAEEVIGSYGLDLDEEKKVSILESSKVGWITNLKDQKDNPCISALALQLILSGLSSRGNSDEKNGENHSVETILQSYYEKSLEVSGIGIDSPERDILEDALISSNGHRKLISVNDELLEKIQFEEKYLDKLLETKIVRKTKPSQDGPSWIEFSHDSILKIAASHHSTKMEQQQKVIEELRKNDIDRRRRKWRGIYYLAEIILGLGFFLASIFCVFPEVLKILLSPQNFTVKNHICYLVWDVLFFLDLFAVVLINPPLLFNRKKIFPLLIVETVVISMLMIVRFIVNPFDCGTIDAQSKFAYYCYISTIFTFIFSVCCHFLQRHLDDDAYEYGYQPLWILLFMLVIAAQVIVLFFSNSSKSMTGYGCQLYDAWPFCVLAPVFTLLILKRKPKCLFLFILLATVVFNIPFCLQIGGFGIAPDKDWPLLLSVITTVVIGLLLMVKEERTVMKVVKPTFFIIVCLMSFYADFGYCKFKIDGVVDRKERLSRPWSYVVVNKDGKYGLMKYDGNEEMPCVFDTIIYNLSTAANDTVKLPYFGLKTTASFGTSNLNFPISYRQGVLYMIPKLYIINRDSLNSSRDSLNSSVFEESYNALLNLAMPHSRQSVSSNLLPQMDSLYNKECRSLKGYLKGLKKSQVLPDTALTHIYSELSKCISTLHLIESYSQAEGGNTAAFVRFINDLNYFYLFRPSIWNLSATIHSKLDGTIDIAVDADTLFYYSDSFPMCFSDTNRNNRSEIYREWKFIHAMDVKYHEDDIQNILMNAKDNVNITSNKVNALFAKADGWSKARQEMLFEVCKEMLACPDMKNFPLIEKLETGTGRIKQEVKDSLDALTALASEISQLGLLGYANTVRINQIKELLPDLLALINEKYPMFNSGIVELHKDIILVCVARGCNMKDDANTLVKRTDSANKAQLQYINKLAKYMDNANSEVKKGSNDIIDFLEPSRKLLNTK